MRRMTMTLRFSGEFNIPVESATKFQCGIKGQPKYRYSAEICCYNDVVDSSTGFIMDNAEIAKYFDSLSKSDSCPSCERLAEASVDYFVTMFRKEYIDPVFIKVTVFPNDYASLEALWTADSAQVIGLDFAPAFGKHSGTTLRKLIDMDELGYVNYILRGGNYSMDRHLRRAMQEKKSELSKVDDIY